MKYLMIMEREMNIMFTIFFLTRAMNVILIGTIRIITLLSKLHQCLVNCVSMFCNTKFKFFKIHFFNELVLCSTAGQKPLLFFPIFSIK